MARDPRKFKLGVFVLTGIAVLLSAVILLGAGQVFRETVTMYCYFDENVSGLDMGSPVSYRGVRIGEVDEVRLVRLPEGSMRPDAPIEVRCSIYPDLLGESDRLMVMQSAFQQEVDMLVARGMRASINWKNITGQKYIALDYYPPSEQPVLDIGVTPRQPWVPTAQTATLADIQRDMATVAHRLANVDYEEISARLVDLLELTTQRVEAFDMQELAGHVERAMIAVRRVAEMPELHAAVARLDEIAESAASATGRLDDLLAKPEMTQAIDDAAAAMRSAAFTAAALERDVPALLERVEGVVAKAGSSIDEADVAGTTESLRGAADSVGTAARDIAGMRADLQRALLEFRRASRSIDRLARALEEDPGVVLRGRGSSEE